MTVCDRLYVLNFGEVISSGDAEKVRRDPAVITAYLGTGVA
jgi:branched-chain amino acid transport system ATP-binding protein